MKKNVLEWMVFAFSALVLAGMLGVLILDVLSDNHKMPVVSVELSAPYLEGEEYVIPLRISNDGEETAEGAVVEVVQTLIDGKEEKATFEVQFLPRLSSREGWVRFKNDPSAARKLEARVVGYERP